MTNIDEIKETLLNKALTELQLMKQSDDYDKHAYNQDFQSYLTGALDVVDFDTYSEIGDLSDALETLVDACDGYSLENPYSPSKAIAFLSDDDFKEAELVKLMDNYRKQLNILDKTLSGAYLWLNKYLSKGDD